MTRKSVVWMLWGVCSVAAAGYLGWRMGGEDQTVFLPGATTHGHYQIELSCESCHTEAFNSLSDLQDACENCHAAELVAANDSHPRAKFTDPRNAERVAILDARYCITCHQEHRPDRTGTMGLSLPGDYCYHCHQSIEEDVPSHAGLPFDGCAAAGCHNFHDNQGIYEDFLLAHLDEPDMRPGGTVKMRAAVDDAKALSAHDHDAPDTVVELSHWVREWSETSHAAAGVNCSGCHQSAVTAGVWSNEVPREVCADCHAGQDEGFLAGRHGMRLAADLAPMRPALARLPMKAEAAERELGCSSCHSAHDFDTRSAAVAACLGCHDDEHTRAYEESPHADLWRAELRGESDAGTGVSCATCHLPRFDAGRGVVSVQHNQNDNLRPNEKMIRTVCLDCHGLGFAIDALADPKLVANNFSGKPAVHVESIEMAKAKLGDS